MIILNKKRIILFVLVVFMSVIIYFIYSVKGSAVVLKEVDNITKKTVILDAGHRRT